jgi:histidine kinase/DNA gyrase B/HSP90-like ATPase
MPALCSRWSSIFATNARDAMPEGGRLWIDVELASPADQLVAAAEWGAAGHCVVLAVADHGIVMDPETAARIFEPFFSTKPPEQGTGLGIAMVYGLMKQHLGYVLVESEPGKGTEVRLYFPVSAETVQTAKPELRQVPQTEDQTILVVEDQEAVLIVSDAIMPRMGGLARYEAVNRERPGVRFLLTSGYTGEEVRNGAPTSAELPFLPTVDRE